MNQAENPSFAIDLAGFIRDVPDFPKQGIIFKDITPLLLDPEALRESVRVMAEPHLDERVDVVVAPEARGFIFGAAVACTLGAGFVPVRKPGKLPHDTTQITYDLEYGTDTLEIHTDAIEKGQKVLMVDDLLATGGTMAACCEMVEKLGGKIVCIEFLIELAFLDGRKFLEKYPVRSQIVFDAE